MNQDCSLAGCDESCLTCSGPKPSDCLSCEASRRRDVSGHCVRSGECSVGSYMDQNGECQQCHPVCLHCHGSDRDHCLSCDEQHFLFSELSRCWRDAGQRTLSKRKTSQNDLWGLNVWTVCSADSTCVETCPVGYYVEAKGERVCRPCYYSCESCDGRHSKQCIACKPGFFKHGSSCVETCPERLERTHLMRRSFTNGVLLAKQTFNLLRSHFGNRTSKVCERCDPSCTKCFGHGNTRCLSCRHDYLYMKQSRQCLKSCPSGYYKDKWSTNCLKCDPTCKTCSGKDRLY